MPNERKIGQRIREGLYDVSDMTDTYEVIQLEVQEDQDDSDWWVLDGWRSTPPKPARRTKMADGSVKRDGFYSFDWVITYMSFGMLAYWLDRFLPNGADAASVTVMTYDENDEAVFLQCIINRPELPGDGEPTMGGWMNVRWRFDTGVVITD
jgi:hypothetical protein